MKNRGEVNKKMIRPQLKLFFYYEPPKKAPESVHHFCLNLLSNILFPVTFIWCL